LHLPDSFHEKTDIHIHVPSGGMPKDGPSAGITIATALVSAATRRAVRKDVVMTGEITLRGRVLPIGGLKEKVLAAHRAGIRTVILPDKNRKDLEDVPAAVQRQMEFVFVDHMDATLPVAIPTMEWTTAASADRAPTVRRPKPHWPARRPRPVRRSRLGSNCAL
jgi:ATP-dependent Lon protease